MAKRYRPVDRDQPFLLPPSMREWLPPDHLAWFVLDVVASVDTSAFHADRVQSGRGRAAYDPDMLVALLLYASCDGVRSSRQIERRCATDVAYRVICAQDVPDHATLARFKAAHEEAVATLFTEVLKLCARAGMGRVGVVAVDGAKVAANASPAANRDEAWLAEQAALAEQALAEQAAAIVAEAVATDAAEDVLFGAGRGDELPGELAEPTGRVARIRRCRDELAAEREAAAQRHRAAEEQRAAQAAEQARQAEQRAQQVREQQQSKAEAYQAAWRQAVDRGEPLPKGAPPVVPDEHAGVRRAEQAAEKARDAAARAQEQAQAPPPEPTTKRGARPTRNVTDPDSRLFPTRGGGWTQGFNVQVVTSDDHLILATAVTQAHSDADCFVPMMQAAQAATATVGAARGEPDLAIGTLVADAGYLSEANLTAEGPDRLVATSKRAATEKAARDHPAEHDPPPDADPVDRMRHRLRTPEGIATYRRRGATVEPVIGHLKDVARLRRFLRRGLDAVQAELDLAATAINICRWHTRATSALA